MRARQTTFGLIAAIGLAACGTSRLDTNKAATTIRTLVTSKLALTVTSVKCPSNVKLKTGLVTTCQVTLAGGETEPFTITQTDSKGDVHIQPTSLLSSGVEKTISARLAAQGVKATATCPQHVAIHVGAKFTCVAKDAKGVSAGILVTITDSIGSYSLTVR